MQVPRYARDRSQPYRSSESCISPALEDPIKIFLPGRASSSSSSSATVGQRKIRIEQEKKALSPPLSPASCFRDTFSACSPPRATDPCLSIQDTLGQIAGCRQPRSTSNLIMSLSRYGEPLEFCLVINLETRNIHAYSVLLLTCLRS